MKVKKYVAANMSEALALIKADLGTDAYIISSQMVKQKGILNLFKSKQLEVTAAVEHRNNTVSVKESRGGLTRSMFVSPKIDNHRETKQILNAFSKLDMQENKVRQETHVTANSQLETYDTQQLINTVLETVEKNNNETFIPNSFTNNVTFKNITSEKQNIQNEDYKLLELEQQMKQMQEKMENLVFQTNQSSSNSSPLEEKNNDSISKQVTPFLKEYDFSEQFEKEFVKYITQLPEYPTTITKSLLRQFLTQEVDYRVVINEVPLGKVNIFVGPPGVGKTTTIAKIASNEILKSNRKIGLITVDTYRIGAVEQLKTYANILNVPLKIVYSVEDMKHALKELDYCDCIIVDSMGRTHKDQENLQELQQLFSQIETKKMFLVLSMSSKYRQLKQIIDNYRVLSYDHLLLTKLDESDRNENLINICYDTQKSITYLCTGQEVPNDIIIASKSYIISSILGGGNDE